MKNKLQYIKATWTYNHKLLIIALGLATAHVIPLIPVPDLSLYAATVEWEAPAQVTLADMVNERAHAIFNERRDIYLEQSRQEAIQEYGHHLVTLTATSTFVDYDALKAQYGY